MSQSHALIIDDNINNVAVLVHMLSQHGVTSSQVITLDQLPPVLAQLRQIDVVFLDLEMPERSGYEVLQELQAEDRFANVPIVAYTVHANEIQTALQVVLSQLSAQAARFRSLWRATGPHLEGRTSVGTGVNLSDGQTSSIMSSRFL